MLSTTSYPASQAENHKKAIEQLNKCSELLHQEKGRWEKLHANPTCDTWEVSSEANGNLKIKLTIDDGVKNIINDQPISREYTLEPKHRQLFKDIDLLVGAQLVAQEGPRPIAGAGIRFDFCKGIGLGVQTSFTGVGGILYYVPSSIPYAFTGLGVGINIWKETTVSLGIGVVL